MDMCDLNYREFKTAVLEGEKAQQDARKHR